MNDRKGRTLHVGDYVITHPSAEHPLFGIVSRAGEASVFVDVGTSWDMCFTNPDDIEVTE